MRMMMRVQVPVEAGNEAIANGSIGEIIRGFIEKHKPEAAYFLAEGGCRTARFVVDVTDPSQIPVLAEAFFMGLAAAVDFVPVMNAEDLARGLAALPKGG
jgi:hypothetical protein